MAYDLTPTGATFGTGKFGQDLTGGQPSLSGLNFVLPITIEAYIKTTSTDLQVTVGLTPGFNFYLGTNTSGKLVASTNPSGSAAIDIIGTRTVNDGAWHHVAAVITASGLSIFSDGIADGSGTQGFRQNNSDTLTIGALSGSSFPFSGEIDEVRISSVDRYSANFTPPTSAFTSDANTLLLYHFDGNTLDSSSSSNGGTTTDGSGHTFGAAKFDQGLVGGQTQQTGFNGTLPITFECYVASTASVLQVAIGESTATPFNFYLGLNNSGFAVASTGNGQHDVIGSTPFNDGALHHLAAVITSGGVTLYADGILQAAGSNYYTANANDTLTIGALYGTSYSFSGTIDEVRVSNIARYTGNFTPPSAAFASDANTLALFHLDGNVTNSATGGSSGGTQTPPAGLGAIKIGCIGDSITAGTNGNPVQAMADYLTAQGYTPTMTNRGVSATTTQDWLPGGSYLGAAISAFQAAGVTIVTIGLGTNDARTPLSLTPSQHTANMILIVGALRAAGFTVVIHHPIWTLPNAGSSGAQWPADPNSVYKGYFAGDVLLADGIGVFVGDAAGFSLFSINPSYLQDGIHPTSASNSILGQLWATGVLYRYGHGNIQKWAHS